MLYDQGYYYKYITYILGLYKEDSDSVDFIEVYKVKFLVNLNCIILH